MKTYKVKIEGTTPLIWNRMKKELEDEKKALKKDELSSWETNRKNWVRKAEFNDNGDVVIPEQWLEANLIDACRKTRMVPNFATTKSQTYTTYASSIMIRNLKDSICKEKDLQEHGEYVGAQGKNSSTKVWRVRPLLKKWTHEFEVIDPFGKMTLKELEELITYGGFILGIGDNRGCNYGRFEVKSIVVKK